ncbi:hypothetical protein ES319_A07G167300v1 [Gossypium barbadense]|uniref:cytokinin riboside 5'-monophosphate phosphoribohydrolase n=2 Tax=Gossypium TaxID=3633 RepID=A0A5J5V4L4_GOSBA|nr:hypothetical protein ES319_A07G167300v1 [Gossypium barbadense]TYI19653.1 hypothetical protein ES332_A07G179500v1 [Gossypium tomentosum]
MEGEVVKLRFKSVCVFCGSRTGKRKCYTDVAVELAQQLVHPNLLPDISLNPVSFLFIRLKGFFSLQQNNIRLMGIVSKTVHRAGGNVMGIIPSTLMRKETHITGETVREVRPVGNRNQRKEAIANHSDCFIALPSGYRTLEELLEVITWVQLGIHDKPIRNNNMVIVELLRRYLPF